jgi:endoglucanase
MQSLYPGDNFVDWTCLDGYNWGPDKGGWKSFDDIFRWSYENIVSFARNKPMLIGEFGSSEKGGSKATWVADTFGAEIPYDFTGLKAVVWYNYLVDQDWRVESSQASLDAFRSSIASSYYSPNAYQDLNASPILPLK